QNEKEWLKKLEEERYEMDRAQKVENARMEGIEIGIKNVIRTMYEKNQNIEFIAQMVDQSVEYVQSVLDEE
ncbi:MAG: hypothetical protein ACI4UK_01445, partial [Floccifex sp.]